ncbi:MAG: hypothetical protein V4760_13545, partial [Bdellovibrionota bacterium]
YFASEASPAPSDALVLKEAGDAFETIVRDLRTVEIEGASEVFKALSPEATNVKSLKAAYERELNFTSKIDPWIPIAWQSTIKVAKLTISNPIVAFMTFAFTVSPWMTVHKAMVDSRVGAMEVNSQIVIALIGSAMYFGLWINVIRKNFSAEVRAKRAAQPASRERAAAMRAKIVALERIMSESKISSPRLRAGLPARCEGLFR